MKQRISPGLLPSKALLITCSSHESRCKGLLSQLDSWRPAEVVLFHYDDYNPKREQNQVLMEESFLAVAVPPSVLQFTEKNPVRSLHDNMRVLRSVLSRLGDAEIVLDISVFTKRHLLMMLRWLDDEGLWDRLVVVYTEPEDYDVSLFIPLSFGIASIQQAPGFSSCADLSRPVHLALFLGYEGDRALAVYEHIQPMRTTLVIPDPPYRSSWLGRTEKFNADFLALVGDGLVERADSIDPESTSAILTSIFGESGTRGDHAKIVCPLGTKPQALGVYSYLRRCVDPPAVVYAGPLRHNHDFFSHCIATTWILKRAQEG